MRKSIYIIGKNGKECFPQMAEIYADENPIWDNLRNLREPKMSAPSTFNYNNNKLYL